MQSLKMLGVSGCNFSPNPTRRLPERYLTRFRLYLVTLCWLTNGFRYCTLQQNPCYCTLQQNPCYCTCSKILAPTNQSIVTARVFLLKFSRGIILGDYGIPRLKHLIVQAIGYGKVMQMEIVCKTMRKKFVRPTLRKIDELDFEKKSVAAFPGRRKFLSLDLLEKILDEKLDPDSIKKIRMGLTFGLGSNVEKEEFPYLMEHLKLILRRCRNVTVFIRLVFPQVLPQGVPPSNTPGYTP